MPAKHGPNIKWVWPMLPIIQINLACYKNEDHKLNAVWNSSGRREKYLLIIIMIIKIIHFGSYKYYFIERVSLSSTSTFRFSKKSDLRVFGFMINL